ncbi:S41 family peptidase [Myxococcus stipitatus]|uniref:S41 family peptidase n=1 Tax=Myxococcus stipitatus TaxID=83455 RepID=UPI0030D4B389
MHWSLKALPLAFLLSLSACGNDDPPRSVEGDWTTETFGLVVKLHGTHVELFERTDVSCLPLASGELTDGRLPELDMRFRLDGDALVIEDSGTLYIRGKRAPAPDDCSHPPPSPKDPVLNFETFWNTFNEQYALFDLYGVDWRARYQQFRPRVSATTTDDELFSLMSEMLTPLRDGHINLSAGQRHFSPKPFPADFYENRDAVIQYIDQRLMKGPGVTLTGRGRLSYQSLNARVGYIVIFNMIRFSEQSDSASEVAAAGKAIDEALAALGDKDALIIDVRFNGGGYDSVALALASRFTSTERLGISKKGRTRDGFTPLRELRFGPAGPRQFTKPVYVLQSGLSASAAEIFTMAMSPLPNVTLVGERSIGAHSDTPTRQLPNGWSFGLSVEQYFAPDGKMYESVGVPTDVAVPLDCASIAAGTDRILEEALRLTAALP